LVAAVALNENTGAAATSSGAGAAGGSVSCGMDELSAAPALDRGHASPKAIMIAHEGFRIAVSIHKTQARRVGAWLAPSC
jgi:hypothetical protein